MRPRASRPSPICSGNPPEPRPVPRRRISTAAAIAFLTLFAVSAHAQTPADSVRGRAGEPIRSAKASDVPNDGGKATHLEWQAPAVDQSVIVSRGTSPSGPFANLDTVSAEAGGFDDTDAPRGTPVYYQLTALGPGGASTPLVLGPVTATAQWFNTPRVNVASFVILFFAFVLYFLWSSRGGRKLFVRRIA
ncbi:MAG TPA: hypothetical protein VGR66_10250, partial [Candidatus Eisenbacteria bacterium]|nr:hypothetical protein [Candidatus Eisenbacteria bacterium]